MSDKINYIDAIFEILSQNSNEKELEWLKAKTSIPNSIPVSFVAVPRFVGKRIIENCTNIEAISLNNWSLARLARVYLILFFEQHSATDTFQKSMETLFETAEINESVALYTAIQFLQKPEKWLQKATDAVRSNISDVFDSLAFNNTFPVKYFSELAFNQLVLKCIFNDKSINQIIGINSRLNEHLANTFSDFAHERWAAGRSVPAEAWQIVEPFVNETILKDLEKLFNSGIDENIKAAASACEHCNFEPAKLLLKKYII
jgi:hypothetical protein